MDYEIFVSEKPVDGREIREIGGVPVVTPIQVHEAHIAFVGSVPESPPVADSLVTDTKNLWIGVLTADCLPIFLIGDGVVGIVHAGWRGTLKGIAFNTVSYIRRFSRIRKAILGVGICGNCYEVGRDVYELFPWKYRECFRHTGENKFLFDLKKANTIQLKAAGVPVIEDLNLCSICNNDRFFSYRKEQTEKRTLSAVRLI